MADVLADGITVGSVYALVALGFVLVFKNSGVLNFSHAETGMFGAFVFYVGWVEQGWPYAIALVTGVVAGAGVGWVTGLLLADGRRDALTMLLGTLGVAGILTFVALDTWGPSPLFIPAFGGGIEIEILGMRFSGAELMIIGTAAAIGLGLFAFYRWTPMGLVFRAMALDPYAAELSGMNVRRLVWATWAAAGALSALAAILIAPLANFQVFFMTFLFLRAVTAALLAGLNSLGGCVAAGLALGVAEAALIRESSEPGLPELLLVVAIVGLLSLRPAALGRRTA